MHTWSAGGKENEIHNVKLNLYCQVAVCINQFRGSRTITTLIIVTAEFNRCIS